VYQVERATEVQQRFDVAAARGLTPLVGREHEVAFLRERWAQVQAGRGHIVLLSGEAGIGKSRLVQVVKDEIIEATTLRIEYRCSAYHQHSAFYPIIAHLERVLALRQEETPEAKLCKLEAALQPYPLPLVEVVPLLAALLAVPLSGSYPPLTLTPQRQKQQTLEVLLTWLLGLTEQQPVLFVVEDLHWIDPSTLEFLTLLVEQGPTARLLALLTCRPEFQPPWGLRTHLTPMALQRLPQPQVEVLIARVTGGKALPPEVVAHIVAKTDGVPLFVEELTKTVLESGLLRETAGHYALTGPVPPLAIPTTLHDSLMARLDRLAAVKTIAQLGATLGREFPYGLLQAVSPWDEETLRQGIQQLVEAEFLYQQGLPPQATYLFKHALIQDAAYQSLLKSTRQRYHQQIAQALEAQFSETVETQPELLAHHYTEAGLVAQAVSYWQRAGERANGRSAYVEASSHLTKGLEVLMNLPQAPERTQRELDIRLTLGLAFMALKGFGAPEVEQTYTKAYDLCQRLQIDSSPQLLQVLYGLRRVYTHRCNLPKAQEIAEHCLHLAQKLHDVYMQIDAYYSLGLSLMQRGDIIAGQAACEQGIALDIHPQQRMVASRRTAIDPGVSCRLFVSWLLWLRGYPDRALRTADEALTLAQALPNPLLHSHALIFVAWLHNYRRERSATQERAEAAIDLAREHTYAQQWAWGIMLRGWAITDRVEGITQIRESLEAALGIGTSAFRPYLLALLIEMHAALGQPAEGMRILAEALELVETTGARLHEAELYRLKGELLLQQTLPDAQQAEAGFQQALDIARRQQAKSWELRAAMSLARLWHQQGKCAEAHALLAPVYGWFTEGFDTADLQDAKALLGTLA
jgi:predicted ATPase